MHSEQKGESARAVRVGTGFLCALMQVRCFRGRLRVRYAVGHVGLVFANRASVADLWKVVRACDPRECAVLACKGFCRHEDILAVLVVDVALQDCERGFRLRWCANVFIEKLDHACDNEARSAALEETLKICARALLEEADEVRHASRDTRAFYRLFGLLRSSNRTEDGAVLREKRSATSFACKIYENTCCIKSNRYDQFV
eukprot:IDg16002t1